jgi:hypothetical protein
VLGCAPIPMPNLHTCTTLAYGIRSTVWLPGYLHAVKQKSHRSLNPAWPLLVALRPGCTRRARKTVSTADKTRLSVASGRLCSRDLFILSALTLATPLQSDMFGRVTLFCLIWWHWTDCECFLLIPFSCSIPKYVSIAILGFVWQI